ncbi:MAG: hypothetical protein DHS20C17_29320 [Cyclobacteriaceae bacterium]|nr:MAG: hypothetical protein DHS20C17_29320 [Cyclobacteriaceae bacterium]
MYRIFCYIPLLILLVTVACREEESELIQTPLEQALARNSSVANLLQSTAMNDGSPDNIIDGASCITVELPVMVLVNGLEITVDSPDDFQVIEDIFDEFEEDDDSLTIQFPITIVLSDFTELVVNNANEFKAFTDECDQDNAEDDDIECIDIEYPISASLFNLSNELISNITLSNDRELYQFIENLTEDIVASVNFPITVFLSDSSNVIISDLQELEQIIQNARDDCDEDDDRDFNDDDCNNCTTDQLSEILQSCPGWKVDKLERADQDLEDNYQSFSFSFFESGLLSVFNGSDSLSGEWQRSGSGNNITVSLNVPGLTDFNDNWILHEIDFDDDDQQVDLRIGDDRLRFESECFDNPDDQGSQEIDSILVDGLWRVASYLDDGDNETNDYDGYQLDFKADGNVTAASNSNTISGTWSTKSGGVELALDFNNSIPFNELNDDDWEVISVAANRIELQDVSGGGGGTDKLVLEKL